MKLYKQTISDVPLDGKTVLLRADYNVPLNEQGEITDDFRITASLPTINELKKRGCKIVIISHLGRPDGKPDITYSLKPVAERLNEVLKDDVHFIEDCIGDKVRMKIKRAPKNSITLLENLRFYSDEEKNDLGFSRKLAKDSGADYFVQDGFGVVHRAHASTSGVTNYLPSVAGKLLSKEYSAITSAMKHPKHPLVAVLGGAKVSDKISVIEALEPIAETILIGGAMANTFLSNAGVDMGASKLEDNQNDEIKRIFKIATAKVGAGNELQFLRLPTDLAVAHHPDKKAKRKNVKFNMLKKDDMALDIGDATIEKYVEIINSASTVIWNGTLGFAELPEFAHGSARIALALATHSNVVSVIGGGDTADFALHWDSNKGKSFSHVSTGGGASLELMSGKKLPGIEALLDSPR